MRGVLTHERSRSYAADVCAERGVKPTMDAVYQALHADDVLAGAFARLLLWTDPRPLPAPNDTEGGWAYYERNWRPGKPHPATGGETYFSSAPFSGVIPVPFAFAVAAIAAGDTISPLAFR